jgi:hypothetical protein
MKKNYHTAEHEEIIKRYKLGDKSVENEVVSICEKLISGVIARQIAKGKSIPISIEDLRDGMMLQLFKCVLPSYDINKGFKFYSYATLALFHYYGNICDKVMMETAVDPFLLAQDKSIYEENNFLSFDEWCQLYENPDDEDAVLIAKNVKQAYININFTKKDGGFTLNHSKFKRCLQGLTKLDDFVIQDVLEMLIGEYYSYLDTN